MYGPWKYTPPQTAPVALHSFYTCQVIGTYFILTVRDSEVTIREANDPMGEFFVRTTLTLPEHTTAQYVLGEAQKWAAPIIAEQIKTRLYKSPVEISN